jgi:UDP-N-acetylmuramoylalanine--D-glutamate ligase
VWLQDDALWMRMDEAHAPSVLMSSADVPLPGIMNRLNVAAASAAALAEGAEPERLAEAVRRFEGVPHRLELVLHRDGVKYYNDSVSTTPESTLAG